MVEEEVHEAGLFGLTPQGWVLLKRRTFPERWAASQWMQRTVNAAARRFPTQKFRGSVVPMGWLTLEKVLADYEAKRKAGDPEFNEWETTQIVVGEQVKASYTDLQGQYLAFIHAYTKLHRQPPAEGEMERHFKVSPSAIHDMILLLEQKKLISRVPGVPRSIRVLLPPGQLPPLE